MDVRQPGAKSEPSYVERLRHHGLRVTPQRLIVLEALAAHSGHITADEILQWVSHGWICRHVDTSGEDLAANT